MAIKACVCQHEFQDQRYGPGKRVVNPCTVGSARSFRCTVCDKTISAPAPTKKAKASDAAADKPKSGKAKK